MRVSNSVIVGLLGCLFSISGQASPLVDDPVIEAALSVWTDVEQMKSNSELDVRERRYDITHEACDGYPFEWKRLSLAANSGVRQLSVRRHRSHGEAIELDRFYDGNENLRYVEFRTSSSVIEIFLDEEGRVYAATRNTGDKTVEYEIADGDWEVTPSSGGGAWALYQRTEGCPVISSRGALQPVGEPDQFLRFAVKLPGYH
jgi:hypothetical protein